MASSHEFLAYRFVYARPPHNMVRTLIMSARARTHTHTHRPIHARTHRVLMRNMIDGTNLKPTKQSVIHGSLTRLGRICDLVTTQK